MNMRIAIGSRGQRRSGARLGLGSCACSLLILLGLLSAPAPAAAEGWGFGWEPGAIVATPKGNPFVFRLTVAKDYSNEFSIGPSLYLTPYGDNAMYSGTLNAQFHVAFEKVRISPFLGIGVAHRKTEHDNDTALMVPMGLSVDTPVGETLYLVGTFSINLHDGITLEGEKDDSSIGLTAGISYNP